MPSNKLVDNSKRVGPQHLSGCGELTPQPPLCFTKRGCKIQYINWFPPLYEVERGTKGGEYS